MMVVIEPGWVDLKLVAIDWLCVVGGAGPRFLAAAGLGGGGDVLNLGGQAIRSGLIVCALFVWCDQVERWVVALQALSAPRMTMTNLAKNHEAVDNAAIGWQLKSSGSERTLMLTTELLGKAPLVRDEPAPSFLTRYSCSSEKVLPQTLSMMQLFITEAGRPCEFEAATSSAARVRSGTVRAVGMVTVLASSASSVRTLETMEKSPSSCCSVEDVETSTKTTHCLRVEGLGDVLCAGTALPSSEGELEWAWRRR